MRKQLFIALFLGIFFSINHDLTAQEATVGLTKYDSRVADGYFLLSTHNSTTTYLMDNCGYVLHKWESEYYPGNTARLTPSGKLLRATKVNTDLFLAGGAGGRIELVNWDGSIEWEFTYLSDLVRHHHDVLEMPNGNILLLSWDAHDKEDAIASGRNPAYLGEMKEDVWSEHIIEVKPLANNEYEIVWEWYLWDHLIQEFDDTKANYGVIADHPEKIDVNYVANATNNPDWIHANGIDYNAELDQIVISGFRFDEVWLIDHSTTTEEAKGSTGGNSGKGGDILYRWGNPFAYGRGTAADQRLFNQHNPHWTGPGAENKMMIFNNGRGRDPEFSSVDFLDLPFENGQYYLDEDGTYGPKELARTYTSIDIEEFKFSRNISGAIELDNGNVLICSGANGNIVEVTAEGEALWNYINPIASSGIVEQGYRYEDHLGTTNLVFRSYKYPLDYPGYDGMTFTPTERIELNPFDRFPCPEVVTALEDFEIAGFELYPNPVAPGMEFSINLENIESVKRAYLVNSLGQVTGDIVCRSSDGNHLFKITTPTIQSGIYNLFIETNQAILSKKIIIGE
jgi:hypothetical protein